MLPATDMIAPTLAFIGGIGSTELLIILVIAFLVLGPSRLPEVARKLGKGVREFRKAADDLRGGLVEDMHDVTKTLRETRDETLAEAREAIEAAARDDDDDDDDDDVDADGARPTDDQPMVPEGEESAGGEKTADTTADSEEEEAEPDVQRDWLGDEDPVVRREPVDDEEARG